jgi:hypothetical protein
MSRQDTAIWTASIDGTPIGQAQRGSGGETTATGHKGWNGGLGETERGGRKTTSDIELVYEVTGSPSLPYLRGAINHPASVHFTPRDDDGNPRMAEQVQYTGRVLGVSWDDTDTMNEGDILFATVTVGVNTP